jgi:hypothetical protein
MANPSALAERSDGSVQIYPPWYFACASDEGPDSRDVGGRLRCGGQICGLNNGVICAYPNNTVAPGTCTVDPSNPTISSQ